MSKNTSKIVEIENGTERTAAEPRSAEVVRIVRGEREVSAAVARVDAEPVMADFRIGWSGLKTQDRTEV